jgi:hypothetical protein
MNTRPTCRFALFALLSTLGSSSSAFAQPASLAQGLGELVETYESHNPKLSTVLKTHLTSSDI